MLDKPEKIELFARAGSKLGYYVEFTAVPPGLPLQHDLRGRFDDRSIEHLSITNGSLWFYVFEDLSENPIGHAVFACGDDAVVCDGVELLPDHECKGIGTAIYDLAEARSGKPARPSENQSEAAKAFWAKRIAR